MYTIYFSGEDMNNQDIYDTFENLSKYEKIKLIMFGKRFYGCNYPIDYEFIAQPEVNSNCVLISNDLKKVIEWEKEGGIGYLIDQINAIDPFLSYPLSKTCRDSWHMIDMVLSLFAI